MNSSFETRRVNATTFVIREDDAYDEHPLIFAKVHCKVPAIILSDTGCDKPSERHKNEAHLTASGPTFSAYVIESALDDALDKYTHLRDYLENYPVEVNGNKPLNANGHLQYIIICTHCHYDHIGGISQFLEGGTTQIIASAAGRDFVESDLESHSLFKYLDRAAPYYQVTKWAQAFERLWYPLESSMPTIDLGITVIHTPGHIPDELAWYDHDEMHLYVGDSFYCEGEDGMPIIWPGEGNLIEWAFSMQKLRCFVKSENARAVASPEENENGWVNLPRRVKVSCAHQTTSVDGEQILDDLEDLWWDVLRCRVPIEKSQKWHGEVYKTWRRKGGENHKMSFLAPERLMLEARDFFI